MTINDPIYTIVVPITVIDCSLEKITIHYPLAEREFLGTFNSFIHTFEWE